MWVQVQVRDPTAGKQLQGTAEFSNHNSPWTSSIVKKPEPQITQQKREEQNSSETIDIWKTNSR